MTPHNCMHCGKPVPSNELTAFRMHENCWVNMQIRAGIIEPVYKPKPPMLIPSKLIKWLNERSEN